ncbi:hypothetical protein TEA_016649 [Camellia sinensis var. sinensis]|uniref:Disease resistance protein At4g27190-like leucine-rich repeats domain-containing protein n=1 Tax=Camellia sinensis var. sinensis TaxID=542762 RepID=A0A4S4D0Q8_CAMSN|nr:hypothetical protein TEA_016649 [Camellia sinensis var. sinensis]
MCLRTLVLDGIKFGDTKFLGQLKTLEVLSLRHAFFSEAPNAIRELTNLRLLDMTESHHEFPIPATMVLPLFHLEELYLFGITSSSIGYLAVEVVAALRSLPRLKMLTISIPDIADIPKDFVFPELESFIIFIGKSRWGVSVEGEGMKLLSSLRDLTLGYLPRLKHILNCSSRQHVQLCNLTYLYVNECGKLKYVFQPSIAQALHQLEKLIVFECEEMEEIVAAKQNEGHEERVDYKMVFKSLKQLYLGRLPNLSGFCTGGDDFPFEWPSLERLEVLDCPKMKTFAATTSGSTPKLKEVQLKVFESGIPLQGMDLNQFVQTHIYHFKAT